MKEKIQAENINYAQISFPTAEVKKYGKIKLKNNSLKNRLTKAK